MAIQWTVQMIKKCSEIYSTEGLEAAIEYTGSSKKSVYAKMRDHGVRCAGDKARGLDKRKYYAEDVVNMLEMSASGLTNSLIAEYYNTTKSSISGVISLAKKNGFDSYPRKGDI